MSASVSQLEFWEKGDPLNNANSDTAGGGSLSYDLFAVLSVLGGYLGLDHLYLRSPLTFLAKVFVNMMFYGVWWLYDASQAIFNRDVIKVFGLGVPGLGPKGIAAGVLAKDGADKKHLRFLIYAAALMFGGTIGLDSFVLGDNESGFIRLICTLTVILAPIALLWWGYELVMFFVYTKEVINENSSYFGGQPGNSKKSRFFAKILSYIVGPIEVAAKPVADAIIKASEAVTGVTSTAKLAIDKGSEIVHDISEVVKDVSSIGKLAPPVSLYSAITPGAIKKAKEKSGEPNSETNGETKGETKGETNGENKETPISPTAEPSAPTAETLGITPKTIAGGALILGASHNLNILPYFLLGTLTFIVVAGFVITYQRSKKDEQNDSPPEPRVFRATDQKRHPA